MDGWEGVFNPPDASKPLYPDERQREIENAAPPVQERESDEGFGKWWMDWHYKNTKPQSEHNFTLGQAVEAAWATAAKQAREGALEEAAKVIEQEIKYPTGAHRRFSDKIRALAAQQKKEG